MMEQGTVITDGRNCFLRIPLPDDLEIGYETKMIERNQPENLLRMQLVQNSREFYADYTVTGLVSLSECEAEGVLIYLYGVLSALSTLSDTCAAYMLEPESVDLSPDHIFIRKEKGTVRFPYVPGKREPVPEMLSRLAEYFMMKGNPKKEEEILLVYGLYRKMREDHVTLKTPLEFWKSMRSEESMVRRNVGQEFPGGAYHSLSEREIYESVGMEQSFAADTSRFDFRTEEPKADSENRPAGSEEAKKTFGERLKQFVRTHILEIGVSFLAFTASALALLF